MPGHLETPIVITDHCKVKQLPQFYFISHPVTPNDCLIPVTPDAVRTAVAWAVCPAKGLTQ